METTVVHARIDKKVKDDVDTILNRLGLTASDAIKLFYYRIQLEKGIPFEMKLTKKQLGKFIDDIGQEAEKSGLVDSSEVLDFIKSDN